jgi:glycosyltransferase involved in cell wall biosynthesis
MSIESSVLLFDKMKVLGLASYPIEAAATRYRMAQFIEPLAAQNIDLIIHPFINSKLYASLYKRSEWPRTAVGLMVAAMGRLGEVWKAHKADLLFIQREAMIFGPPVIEWLAMNLNKCPMVLDLDDATYVAYRSPTYGRVGSALKWFRKTNDLIQWSKVVTCGNQAIANYVETRGRRAVIIPTVVDTDIFRPLNQTGKNGVPIIGWIGTHSTYHYLRSIFPALERLAHQYRFKLKLVGTGKDEIAISGVELENLSWSLEREIADFQSLDIGLYPMVEDDWSVGKSGFKAVQYMAVGVPFVASPVGACAEIGQPNRTHFLAQTEDEWYTQLAKLLEDDAMRRRMGAAGREYATAHYTVAAQAQKLVDTFRSALEA